MVVYCRPAEMGFLESCFSYIFGDGDPNVNFEEERYVGQGHSVGAPGVEGRWMH